MPEVSESHISDDTRQLTLLKKGQYYLFRYQPGEEAIVLQQLMSMAEQPGSGINWFDAAVLSHQMGHRIASELQNLLQGKLGLTAKNGKAADAA